MPKQGTLARDRMLEALDHLDGLLEKRVTLIIGGGGAMVLAHQFPLVTEDIDAIPKGMDLNEIDSLIKRVAQELSLPPDWLNPYFSTFTHTLPSDYGDRLISVYAGKNLAALALSKEELLIMKCFAHRQKDVPHSKALIEKGAEVEFVEKHLDSLLEENVPGSQEALDFLDDVLDQMPGSGEPN
jgi:hypothetical protein